MRSPRPGSELGSNCTRFRLGFAAGGDDAGFVNAHSDPPSGNASVDGLDSGWGGGTALVSVVISSTHLVSTVSRGRVAYARVRL
jgi:hypothetical protein